MATWCEHAVQQAGAVGDPLRTDEWHRSGRGAAGGWGTVAQTVRPDANREAVQTVPGPSLRAVMLKMNQQPTLRGRTTHGRPHQHEGWLAEVADRRCSRVASRAANLLSTKLHRGSLAAPSQPVELRGGEVHMTWQNTHPRRWTTLVGGEHVNSVTHPDHRR